MIRLRQDSFFRVLLLIILPIQRLHVYWNDRAIPEVLLSGNHAAMEQWRLEKAAEKSVYGHFAWVREHCQTEQEIDLVKNIYPLIMLC